MNFFCVAFVYILFFTIEQSPYHGGLTEWDAGTWNVGRSEDLKMGILERWSTGMLEHWNVGRLERGDAEDGVVASNQ